MDDEWPASPVGVLRSLESRAYLGLPHWVLFDPLDTAFVATNLPLGVGYKLPSCGHEFYWSHPCITTHTMPRLCLQPKIPTFRRAESIPSTSAVPGDVILPAIVALPSAFLGDIDAELVVAPTGAENFFTQLSIPIS